MNRLVLAFAAVAVALPIGASAAQSWESVTIQTALAALESALTQLPPTLSQSRWRGFRRARTQRRRSS